MDLDDLKKLAGTHLTVVDFDPTARAAERSRDVAEKRSYADRNNIKPGDPEWFSLYFSNDSACEMPRGFRGRK